MAEAPLLTIAVAAVLLYVLIKGHLYATRKLWKPVFEEEVEGSGEDVGGADVAPDDRDGGDAEDGESEEDRRPSGWDHVG